MKGRVRWLLQELPELIEQGVLDARNAQRLHDHYLPHLDGASSGMRILAVLGATLVGLGIMLLLAHNWPQWSRDVRTVVSFMPLLIGQGLLIWTLLRHADSPAWREGSGGFVFLATGACIALIEQTYHLGADDYAGFLLTWLLLGLPLVYLLKASTPLLMAWGIALGYAWMAQQQWGHALLFWPLWLLGLPHFIAQLRRSPWGLHSQILSWVACGSLIAGTMISLERAIPGLWIPVLATLLAGVYLTHYRWLRSAPDVLRSPFQIIGIGGIVVLSLVLTFDWPWQRIGGEFARSSWYYREFAGLLDYVVLAVLLVWWFGLLRRVLRRRDQLQFLYAGMPMLVIPLYLLADPSLSVLVLTVPMNLYALILGLATLREGMRGNHPVALNVGLLVLCALLMLRFFDSQLSFTARGIAFVLTGCAFLGANLLLRRSMQP